MFVYLPYEYCDANNYKVSGMIHLTRVPTRREIAVIEAALDEGEFFVAEQVGVTPLQGTFFSEDADADHAWHTMNGVSVFSTEVPYAFTVCGPFDPRVLAAAFDKAATDGWNVFLSPYCC